MPYDFVMLIILMIVMVMISANSGLFALLNFFKHVIVLIFLAAKEDKHYYTGN